MSSSFTSTRKSAGGIPYKLIEGYPKISVTDEGVAATEKVLIQSTNLISFWTEYMGAPETLFDNTWIPARRGLPGNLSAALKCTSLQFEPFTGELPGDPLTADSGAPDGTYDDVYACTIEYSTKGPQQSDSPPGVSEQTDEYGHTVTAGGQALTISPRQTEMSKEDTEAGETTIDDDGNVPDAGADVEENSDLLQPIVKMMPTIEHTLSHPARKISSEQWLNIVLGLGRVNDTCDANENFFMDAKKDTVLFMGYSASQSWHIDPNTAERYDLWKIDFRFSQRYFKEGGKVRGWNHVWCPKQQGWREVRRTGEGGKKSLYSRYDFDKIFNLSSD